MAPTAPEQPPGHPWQGRTGNQPGPAAGRIGGQMQGQEFPWGFWDPCGWGALQKGTGGAGVCAWEALQGDRGTSASVDEGTQSFEDEGTGLSAEHGDRDACRQEGTWGFENGGTGVPKEMGTWGPY